MKLNITVKNRMSLLQPQLLRQNHNASMTSVVDTADTCPNKAGARRGAWYDLRL